ncbi:MAG TPA: YARHG domain-containing protein [Pyrinomonadaceae bacterium]|nr:YARHG domain-containing protein [Pyrinomonadaceae bacterium]
MRKRLIIFLMLVLTLGAVSVYAQDEFERERRQAWKAFEKKGWDKFDYTKKKITKAQLAKIKSDGVIDELALLRGVVFGKRGRVFKERSIQDFLEKQTWYKPNPAFSNSVLTKMERDNLDAIRMMEAERRLSIAPGDLRYWQTKEIPDDNLYAETPSDWRIMIAEIEAIHGKRFDDEPWLQKYFEERYWYKPNQNYDSSVLNEFERKNLEKLNAKRNEDRKIAVAVGDMDRFQNVLLTEDLLKNLSMNDLRMMRNEFWARRGRKFTTPGFKQMFEWRDWYKPEKDQSKVKLNEIEEQNVKLLEREEAKLRDKIINEPITAEMVEGLFVEDLRVLRNEIYARRGRVFKDASLQKYFAAQAWYQPNPEFKDENLTEIESKNLAVIKQVEEYSISKFSEAEG